MKNNAFVRNTGHFDNEIDLPRSKGLEGMSVDEVFVFPVGQGVIVHEIGVRLHTVWLFSDLQVRRLLRTGELEEKVTKLHLPALGEALNVLTQAVPNFERAFAWSGKAFDVGQGCVGRHLSPHTYTEVEFRS